jgi:hypothetical protein
MPQRHFTSRLDKRRRISGAELAENIAALHTQHLVAATPSSPSSLPRDEGVASTVPNFLCNAAQSFGKEWENGLRQNEDQNYETDRNITIQPQQK